MSVLYRYAPINLTRQRHDEVNRRLTEGGHWPAPGCELHVVFGSDDDLKVSQIWSSSDQQEAFAQHLRPILEQAGVQLAGPPEVFEVQELERF